MTLLFIAFVVIIFGYVWTKKRYSYWSSKGVEGPKPFPIVGNFGTVMAAKEHQDSLYQRIYNEYSDKPYVGIYIATKPALLLRDPEIIKQILIKDFSIFQNRGLKSAYPHNDNAFSADGKTSKVLRSILSPSFTIGKLKTRIFLYEKCADEFLKYVDDSLERGSDHEMQYDLMWRYNLHVIGAFMFGSDLNALSNDENYFKHCMDGVILPNLRSRIILYMDQIIPGFQKFASLLKMDSRVNEISTFFNFVNKVIEGRRGQPAGLNDFTDQILKLKKQNFFEEQSKLVEFERIDWALLNQFVIMYTSHVDSVTSFMSLLLNELAFNQEIQDRVLREILEVTDYQNKKITYESLNDMVYLEMVLNELWRMYANTFIQREAVSDYEFPDTKLKIKKGTVIIVPVLGLHKDPNYFEDPEVFNPERFSSQNKKNISDCTFLPFGDGPRICVGMNSAKLQLKYGVAAIVRRFKFEPCETSTKQVECFITAITLNKPKQVWLKVSKRTTQ